MAYTQTHIFKFNLSPQKVEKSFQTNKKASFITTHILFYTFQEVHQTSSMTLLI